jgi:hypothetical protein
VNIPLQRSHGVSFLKGASVTNDKCGKTVVAGKVLNVSETQEKNENITFCNWASKNNK